MRRCKPPQSRNVGAPRMPRTLTRRCVKSIYPIVLAAWRRTLRCVLCDGANICTHNPLQALCEAEGDALMVDFALLDARGGVRLGRCGLRQHQEST